MQFICHINPPGKTRVASFAVHSFRPGYFAPYSRTRNIIFEAMMLVLDVYGLL